MVKVKLHQVCTLVYRRFTREQKEMDESHPKVLFDVMPRIWLRPCKKEELSTAPSYDCPGLWSKSKKRIFRQKKQV